MYANNKTLAPKKDKDGNNVNGDLDLSKWKDFDYTEVEESTTKAASVEVQSIDFE